MGITVLIARYLGEKKEQSIGQVIGGGTVVATGTPEQVADTPASYTGQYLKKLLAR